MWINAWQRLATPAHWSATFAATLDGFILFFQPFLTIHLRGRFRVTFNAVPDGILGPATLLRRRSISGLMRFIASV